MSPVFVLAPDSFKESMSAFEACQAMQSGIQTVFPYAQFIACPMADGGEGTVDTIIHATSAKKIYAEVTTQHTKNNHLLRLN